MSPYVPFDVPVEYVPHLYGIFFTSIATFYVMLGGMLSIVCDVLMIPSLLGMWRAFGELNEVARREHAGLWRPEHA